MKNVLICLMAVAMAGCARVGDSDPPSQSGVEEVPTSTQTLLEANLPESTYYITDPDTGCEYILFHTGYGTGLSPRMYTTESGHYMHKGCERRQ